MNSRSKLLLAGGILVTIALLAAAVVAYPLDEEAAASEEPASPPPAPPRYYFVANVLPPADVNGSAILTLGVVSDGGPNGTLTAATDESPQSPLMASVIVVSADFTQAPIGPDANVSLNDFLLANGGALQYVRGKAQRAGDSFEMSVRLRQYDTSGNETLARGVIIHNPESGGLLFVDLWYGTTTRWYQDDYGSGWIRMDAPIMPAAG